MLNGRYNAGAADWVVVRNPDNIANRGYRVTAADSLRTHADLATSRAMLISETLNFAPALVVRWYGRASVAESLGVSATLTLARPAGVSEQLRLSAVQTVTWVVQLAEDLGLTASLATKAAYHVGVSESLYISAALAKFLGASVSEQLGVSAAAVPSRKTSGAVTEALGLHEVVTPKLLMRVNISESLRVSAAQAVKGLYSATIAEQLGLAVGYLAPNGSFTTWTTNTRTGAVTEYENYAFNSFAKLGDRYVGATSSGVYELLGDTDAGSAIIAEMTGAFLQFGGTHLSRLKAAYIATHGTAGNFVLKIETLDGVTYTYSAETRSGRSSKVHMGKGQRSRYFAYTLTSLGQDFDLDTLEFVPIVLDRRV